MNLRPVLHSLVAIGMLGWLAQADAARATVVVKSSLEQMAAGADVVARVVVRDQRVVRDGGRLVTYTSMDVADGIKGVATGETIEVFQVGGSFDGRTSWVVGAHRFRKGEDLVFFGVRHARGTHLFIPWGVGVGLFEVQTDVNGAAVVELIGDVALVERGADGATRTVPPQPTRYDSYTSFRAAIEQVLDGRALAEPLAKTKIGPALRAPARVAAPASEPAPSTTSGGEGR